MKMMNNLLLASKVAERDGLAIIQRYNSIDSYFSNQDRQISKIYRNRDLKLIEEGIHTAEINGFLTSADRSA